MAPRYRKKPLFLKGGAEQYRPFSGHAVLCSIPQKNWRIGVGIVCIAFNPPPYQMLPVVGVLFGFPMLDATGSIDLFEDRFPPHERADQNDAIHIFWVMPQIKKASQPSH